MVTEYLHGLMDVNIRVSTRTTRNMVRVHTHGQMGVNTLENGEMIEDTDLGNTF